MEPLADREHLEPAVLHGVVPRQPGLGAPTINDPPPVECRHWEGQSEAVLPHGRKVVPEPGPLVAPGRSLEYQVACAPRERGVPVQHLARSRDAEGGEYDATRLCLLD